MIKKPQLREAQLATSRSKALPDDWSDWFPQCIKLALGITTGVVTARDVLDYAMLRATDTDGSCKLEAAQCLMLLHMLDNPEENEVIVAV